uniref:diacylglycerol/lipid kinase family protein n=1 Tax=Altererythrobacter segetis TaxID=1104773 RepID=UPI00140A9BE9|nr:acylglycerol kinase family protein [Altererythrobacter segetis]
MTGTQRIWLVVNDASGSNDEQAIANLERSCTDAGFALERIIRFPEQPLPTGEGLDRAGMRIIAVFAGDGTVNALVNTLSGWSGKILVLPGGTMNLLYHRLHGDRDAGDVVRIVAAGDARPTRPGVIACRAGTALADVLAGPGTRWYDVREAMREADVLAVAGSAAQALGETLAKPGIACREPALGRAEGYPLVMLTPTDEGLRVCGFYAETPREFLEGSWALLRRRFREGPHDELGLVDRITLVSTVEEPFGVLIDGEKAESPGQAEFRLVPCGVDLLATRSDGR